MALSDAIGYAITIIIPMSSKLIGVFEINQSKCPSAIPMIAEMWNNQTIKMAPLRFVKKGVQLVIGRYLVRNYFG